MRIFKYWVESKKELDIEGAKQLSKSFGGSNISIEEAKKDADRKLEKAQENINSKEYIRDDNYEVDIIEEVIDEIDDSNIITRNRYGALVLNSKSTMFIDIDNYSPSLWDILFKREYNAKENIFKKIEKTVSKRKYSNFGFRIYETFKGYRVLVVGKEFDPRSPESEQMMVDFRSDNLYSWLCVKQNCYRARLTPKPYRMRFKGIKVKFPFKDSEHEKNQKEWVKDYEKKSKEYSSCHLIKIIGNQTENRAVYYHDQITQVNYKYKLA